MRKIHEIVKIIEIEPFHSGDGDAFRFRLEVLRDLGSDTFTGRVYRLETYRLQPTYPQSAGVPPQWSDDGLIHVVDHTFDAVPLIGSSIDELVAKFRKALSDVFGPT